MSDEEYRKAARIIVKTGVFPFPINDTLLEILKSVVNEEELDFIMAFRRKISQTMNELKESSKMSEQQILNHVNKLAKVGLIFNQTNSKGKVVFRLMPLVMIGLFEYTFMKKLNFTEKERHLARLFSKLFNELGVFIQDEYDTIVPIFENIRPFDRTLPIKGKNVNDKEINIVINSEVEVPEEKILPTKEFEDIINKFDDIAVGHCFCRHHKDLLGEPCKQTDLRENCFTLGKSARYTVEHGFARMINKEEALDILKKSEKAGLVHKAFHPHSDIYKDETSICNCCKDCCGTFEWWKTGMTAMINYAHYLAEIDVNYCVGCGTCVDKCPVDAISLNEYNKAELNPNWCIGCGVCTYFCPESAISLLENFRKIYVPPPRLRS